MNDRQRAPKLSADSVPGSFGSLKGEGGEFAESLRDVAEARGELGLHRREFAADGGGYEGAQRGTGIAGLWGEFHEGSG